MADTKISSASTSNFSGMTDLDFSVNARNTDGASDQDETRWTFTSWPQYFGYYKQIPELKAAIDAIARWTIGRGYQADPFTSQILRKITGYGQDDFNMILKNLIVVSIILGDAFAEIIRNEKGQLINIKPLDPGSMVVIVDRKGRIKRYEQASKITGANPTKFEVKDIFHLVRGRVADEVHGTSIIESVEGIIKKRNEALDDMQKWQHRNAYPQKVWKLDTDDPAQIAAFTAKVETSVKDKENIFVPKGNVEIEWPTVPNASDNSIRWIEYLSGFFFQAVGIPQIILGGSQEFTEATAKIAYLAFQQSVEDEQRFIENQLLLQLGLSIVLEFPASLENELLSDQKKDGNTAFQPSETTASVTPGVNRGS